LTTKQRNGGSKWEQIHPIISFLVGAYLLVRTNNPTTLIGLVSLVLMGVLPVSLLEKYVNGKKEP
jgi:hypothetical protein